MNRASSKNGDRELQTSHKNDLSIVPMKLEKILKKFKTHRCAMDFNCAFCKTVYKERDSPD
jgi:hypothetical protein